MQLVFTRVQAQSAQLGPVSALGHKRTFAVQNVMSALPPTADICSVQAHVRFVPIADITLHHSITASAVVNSDGGMVRPSVFAVFRLITNSNFAGCTTGISAGFSPLRIRPA